MRTIFLSCFAVPLGLYDACLAMLNLRCLAIVFDLDETLIVANTMKSFEDRIEALKGWLFRGSHSSPTPSSPASTTLAFRVSGLEARSLTYQKIFIV